MKKTDFISGLLYCIFGAISIPGLVFLIIFSAKSGNALKVVSTTIYGSALFLLMLFTTLNKWLPLKATGKRIFRKFNHILIYIFIACTYTPICLVILNGAWGWSLFGVIWLLSIIGIIFNSIWVNYPRVLYSIIYICMGLIILIGINPLFQNLKQLDSINQFLFLILGAFFYIIAGVIYAFNSCKTNVLTCQFFNILILSGISCHYWFIFRYII